MKIRQVFQAIFAITIAAMILFILPTSFVFAAGNQNNQAMNKSALLVASEPNARINIYPKPNTHNHRIGYGLSGDRVTVLEQVGSNEGYTWNHIRFDNSPYLEGWVREDSIFLEEMPTRSLSTRQSNQSKYDSGNYYFSNQPNGYQTYQRNSRRDNGYNNYFQQ